MSFLNGCCHWFKYCCTLLETVGLHGPNLKFRDLVCFALILNVETVLLVDAFRRHMPSTVISIYSMEVRSRLI